MKFRSAIPILAAVFLAAWGPVVPARAGEVVETLKKGAHGWARNYAHTIDDFPGFAKNPETDSYGGWRAFRLEATGFFRVAEHGGRWWFVTPEGHPFLSMAVTTVKMGESDEMRQRCSSTFGGADAWAVSTIDMLHSAGINSLGCWTDVKHFRGRIPYAAFVGCVKPYISRKGIKLESGKNQDAVMRGILDDPEFEKLLDRKISKAVEEVGSDPYCMGWFVDNEIPWDRKHPETLERYLSLVLRTLRKYDTEHLYLGCRFNNWGQELSSPELLRVAGKYMDVIPVNHYAYWEPDFRQFDRIEKWSGRPAMVTEFYAKGEDSGMKNTSGGGWIVHTQKDRGLFYQNFVLELLKSRACVGWQWFRYQDNDPSNKKVDPSNVDSNKGVVDGRFNPYFEVLSSMTKVNSRAFALADSLFRRRVGGSVTDASTGRGIPGVAVSDGYGVTLTSDDGSFSFPKDDRKQIFSITVPSGYAIPLNPGTGLPAHYGGPDFCLTPVEGPSDFDIIAIGDPQARSDRQVKRYVSETLADIQSNASRGTLAFALGDIVSDSDGTWLPMFDAVKNLKTSDGSPLAYFGVMGNHDSDRYDDPVDSSAVRFERFYGPRNFSIDRGNVHIVVMDDIFRTEPKANKSVNGRTWAFKGGFTVEQYRWLLDDFAAVKDRETKTLVFVCHIPFDDKVLTQRRALFLEAFAGFGSAHILSGHKHFTINRTYDDYVCRGGQPVYDHTHVAAGGNVWFSSVARDATPNGYAVYSFRDGRLWNWRFKGTGLSPDEQFRVYDGNDVYTLSNGETVKWEDKFAGAFVVDLWNDDASNWRVELYRKGKKVGTFRRAGGKSFHPLTLRTVEADVAARKWGDAKSWRKPYDAHLWYFVPKGGNPSKMKDWEIRAIQTIPGTGTVNVYKADSITK